MGRLETRASNLDNRVVEGYAIVWGQRDSYGTKFVKGCCAKSIREHGPGSNAPYQIKFLYQHNQRDALSLFAELREDDFGLYFRTVPLDAGDLEDRVLVKLRSGTLNNFSQGFDYVWDRIEWDDSDNSMVCLEIELFELSVVSIPSGMETYAIRSKEEIEFLYDETDDYIKSLPRKFQLEARELFARHKSLVNISAPHEQRQNAPGENAPAPDGINYDYLIANL